MKTVQFVAEHVFIKQLATQVRAGFGLVPFIGSGCSSASGILMGEEFTNYLAWTTCICVADRQNWPGGSNIAGKRWDLRRSGWPKQPNEEEIRVAKTWVHDEFCALAKRCGLQVDDDTLNNNVRSLSQSPAETAKPDALAGLLYAPFVPPFLRGGDAASGGLMDSRYLRQMHALLGGRGVVEGGLVRPEISPTSEDAIVERAIRSLYDWRATLRFLAELQLSADGHTLFLVEPDPAVIDGFNVHITKGARPNLTHTMLCHLREPARARLVLTTNFDTLIEDAYAEQQRRIEPISVSLKGALPDPEIVHARDTVVKLHGTFSETRADFSLDDPPTLEDRRKFFHYVRGGFPGEATTGHYLPGHLLVAGYSGSDARCVQLMKYVLDSDPEALLFWINFSSHSRQRLLALFPEKAYAGRIFVTETERADLLLYEFYQYLCLGLPPGGSSYQLNHSVPPSSSFRPNLDEDRVLAPGATEIIKAVDWLKLADKPTPATAPPCCPRLLVVDGPSGVLPALRSAFNSLSDTHRLQKVWLELEDFPNTASVAYELLQTIAIKRGLFQRRHAELCPGSLSDPIELNEAQQAHLRGLQEKAHEAWQKWNEQEQKPSDQRDAAQVAALLGAYKAAEDELREEVMSPFEVRVKDWTRHLKLMRRHLDIDPKKWLVVLYGRNGPGGCCGWTEHRYWDGGPSGDDGDGAGKPAVEYGTCPAWDDKEAIHQPSTFAALLRALVKAGFTVIYAPYTPSRQEADQKRKAKLTEILADWWHPLRLSDDARRGLIKEEVEKTFLYPARSHRKEDLSRWLGDPGRNAGWQWLDLPTQPEPATGPSVFGRTMERVLRQELTLDGPDSRRHAHDRFNFIFGASLFRQSRHYTAFLSEGVIRCPERFNRDGFDNDLVRNKLLGEWLERLNRWPSIFHRKPGGFAWAYRDIRVGMRCVAEVVSKLIANHHASPAASPPKTGEDAAAASSPASDRLDLLACEQLRARTHFWIGEWYLRAFLISGHADPLMEAAYHFYQCVWHAQYAASSNPKLGAGDWSYQMLWWRQGLVQLVKVLRLGAQPLRFWFGVPQSKAWFEAEHRATVLERVRTAYKEIQKQRHGAVPDREEEIEAVLGSLGQALRGEKTEEAKWQEHMDKLRRWHEEATPPARDESVVSARLQDLLRDEMEQYDERRTHPFRIRRYPSLRGVVGTGPEDGGLPHSAPPAGGPPYGATNTRRYVNQMVVTPGPDWWRGWWPEGSEDHPVRVLLETTQHLTVTGQEDTALDWHKLTSLQLKYFRLDPAYAVSLMQQLIEWAFILVRRAKSEEHAVPVYCLPGKLLPKGTVPDGRRILLTPPQVRGQWVRVCIFASWALDLERWLPPGMEDFCLRECSKALGIYGLALARLHRFREAQRRFTHAYALLSQVGGPVPHVLYGVLDIRRAEAYLLEANVTRDLVGLLEEKGQGGTLCVEIENNRLKEQFTFQDDAGEEAAKQWRLSQWFKDQGLRSSRRQALWDWLEDRLSPLEHPAALSQAETVQVRLRRFAAARCDDAWSCLERAERLLGGRTHSVRWWARLCSLQLRAFGTTSGLNEAGPGSASGSVRRGAGRAPRQLFQRQRFEPLNSLEELWREGRAAAPEDDYNRIRMLDYYVRALSNVETMFADKRHDPKLMAAEQKRLRRKIDAELKRIDGMIDAELKQSGNSVASTASLKTSYLENVRARIERLWEKMTK